MLRRILLVEDDEHDCELTLEALAEERLANHIDRVRDGVEALDYLFYRNDYADRSTENPVFILLDLKMPRLSGIDVLKKIRETPALRSIPVVMLTSSQEDTDLKRCYELGVNGYVVKPVEFDGFMEAIKRIGLYWGILNIPAP